MSFDQQDKEATLSSREFSSDSSSIKNSVLQKEVALLRKKLEIIETMSDGKCSVVSKLSNVEEQQKENFRSNSKPLPQTETDPKFSLDKSYSILKMSLTERRHAFKEQQSKQNKSQTTAQKFNILLSDTLGKRSLLKELKQGNQQTQQTEKKNFDQAIQIEDDQTENKPIDEDDNLVNKKRKYRKRTRKTSEESVEEGNRKLYKRVKVSKQV